MHCARALGRAVRPAVVRVLPRGVVCAPVRQQRELSFSAPLLYPGRGRYDDDDADEDRRPPRRDDDRRPPRDDRRRDYDDRPRRRRDDDEDDRPPRRRYDDDDDDRRPPRRSEDRDYRDDRRPRSDRGDRDWDRRGDRLDERPPRREREAPPRQEEPEPAEKEPPLRAQKIEDVDEASAPKEEREEKPASSNVQLTLRWEVYPDHDAYTGDNVEVWVAEGCQYGDHEKGEHATLKKGGFTLDEAKAYAEKKNFGAFVQWRKNVYFRRRRADQVVDRKYKASGADLHIGFKS